MSEDMTEILDTLTPEQAGLGNTSDHLMNLSLAQNSTEIPSDCGLELTPYTLWSLQVIGQGVQGKGRHFVLCLLSHIPQ